MLEIVEIFGPTIQGEGKYCGKPSVFIRLARCNLKCQGFGVAYCDSNGQDKIGCDSFYAVDPSYKNEWSIYDEIQPIIQEIGALLKNIPVKPMIVFTGGEPLIHWKNDLFQELLAYYTNGGYQILIETNGSIEIALEREYHQKIIFSISVKLSYSGDLENKRLNKVALHKLFLHNQASYYKFVVASEYEEECEYEIQEIVKDYNPSNVFIMPKGATKKELEKHTLCAAHLALRNGYTYSDRLHIRLWDSRRGV